MKNRICMLTILLALAFTGCGQQESDGDKEPETAATENADQADEAETEEETERFEQDPSRASETTTTTTTTTMTTTTTATVTDPGSMPVAADDSLGSGHEIVLPFHEDELVFSFSSGVGGWGTELNLAKDGTFTGYYHDGEFGNVGEGYEGGTVYECSFSGKFSNFNKISDTTYRMEIERLEYDRNLDSETIIDGVRYVTAAPYGLTEGGIYEFYTKDKKVSEINEEALSWWEGRFELQYDAKNERYVIPKDMILECYGITVFSGDYDEETGKEIVYGFYSYD